jgi:hypothetical protein
MRLHIRSRSQPLISRISTTADARNARAFCRSRSHPLKGWLNLTFGLTLRRLPNIELRRRPNWNLTSPCSLSRAATLPRILRRDDLRSCAGLRMARSRSGSAMASAESGGLVMTDRVGEDYSRGFGV